MKTNRKMSWQKLSSDLLSRKLIGYPRQIFRMGFDNYPSRCEQLADDIKERAMLKSRAATQPCNTRLRADWKIITLGVG